MDNDSVEVVVCFQNKTKLKLINSLVSTFAVFNSTTNTSPYSLFDPTSEEE